jgi:hypothetical protein
MGIAEDFLARCSSISNIKSQPRAKKDREAGKLSASAMAEVKKYLLWKRMKRSTSFSNRFTEKGNLNEEEAITLVNKVLYPKLILENNKERESNEYVTGECDLYISRDNVIRDIKNSWDIFTFPIYEEKTLEKNYHDQMQGYLELWDCETGYVDKCLTDTPIGILDSYLFKKYRNLDTFETTDGVYDRDEMGKIFIKDEAMESIKEEVFKSIYTEKGLQRYIDDGAFRLDDDFMFNGFYEIPEKERVISFEVKRNKAFMEEVNEAVIICRNYINRIL